MLSRTMCMDQCQKKLETASHSSTAGPLKTRIHPCSHAELPMCWSTSSEQHCPHTRGRHAGGVLSAAALAWQHSITSCATRVAVPKAYLMPLTSRYSSCRGKGGCSLKALGSGVLNTSDGLCRHGVHHEQRKQHWLAQSVHRGDHHTATARLQLAFR